MKKKIVVILICMMMSTTFAGAYSSVNISIESRNEESSNIPATHDVLGEFFTMTTCVPCKYSHRALKNLYDNKTKWNLPFYYITMVYDDEGNKWAAQRKEELKVVASPTTCWDGDFRRDVGGSDVEKEMGRFNTSIRNCGNRNVKDIDLTLDVEWLGAVNPDPPDDETRVPVETNLSWTVTSMDIDVGVKNNEGSQYNGHLHVYVTEVESSYWDDKFDDPYTFAFLDYAWNEDITLTAGGQWSDSDEWDGADHQDGYGKFYTELYQDNCQVIATIFDEDNNDYTDETVGVLAGEDTEPKTFDVYFGNSSPPPKVLSKSPLNIYNPDGNLDFNVTYYWKVDVWDNQSNKTPGDEWDFTTRKNDPPEKPWKESPYNGSKDIPIDINLSWSCNDPDLDDVTFDVYFGTDPFNLDHVSRNQTEREYDPGILDFDTKYFWQIIAWDEYEYKTVGDKWDFTTQINEPPNPPKDPYPPDGENAVPVNVTLSWNGTDPNSGDTLTYDVYFDDAFPPYKREENRKENWWKPDNDLTLHKTYYWYIVARDSQGLETQGPNWTFTTGINRKPTDPIINGPSEGFIGESYEFSFNSTDPDGHDIKYYVDWDDGNANETDFFKSGEMATFTHSWQDAGIYYIGIIAEDNYGADSNESIHKIEIKRKSRVFAFNFLEWLVQRFPRALLLRYIIGYDLP